MDQPQASARDNAPIRLIAVQATGMVLIDRVWDAGAAALPLDPSLPARAARAAASALGAHALAGPTGIAALGGGAPVPPGTALVVRTSGTTGSPRGVMLSHTALAAGVAASIDRLDAHDARWLAVLPTHHVAGVLVALRARAAGQPLTMRERFDVADVAAVAGANEATHVALVPTMLHRLLDRGVDVARFARILLGGARPPASLLARADAAGAHVTVSYGLTETCGGCVYDGVPLDGVAVAIDPDRRVLVRGPVLADGYRMGGEIVPLATRDDWFATNDVGHFDPDGRLIVDGRADDVIVSGGVNVSTVAVADLLRDHPQVRDAAVVGVSDPEWGERAVAFVVPVDAAQPPSTATLRAHVRSAAGPDAALKEVHRLGALPRTALGKVDRGALRRRVGADTRSERP